MKASARALSPRTVPAAARAALTLLFFLSGAAALVYEVLWLKDLSLLFGNTAHAAAATLSIFFLGLGAGGWHWGRRAATVAHPLRTYALLEFGVAAAALLYFGLIDFYRLIYSPLHAALGDWPLLVTAARFALAFVALFPAAFLMGGSYPVMGQFLIRSPVLLGRTGSLLYAVNTLGAAAGALLAGFFLPWRFGFARSYAVAVALNALTGGAAWLLARRLRPAEAPAAEKRTPPAGRIGDEAPLIAAIAFAAGFLGLGLEVIWTRMFSQVLQNSVYTFAAILVVFLALLGLGGFLANRLIRWRASGEAALPALLTLAGFATALTPYFFLDVTDGLRYLGAGKSWGPYLISIFTNISLVLILPGLFTGMIFPFLLRLRERRGESPGEAIGRLAALNTAGAVAGSFAAGFVFIGWVGLWGSLRLFAALYFLLALAAPRAAGRVWLLRAAPAAGILCLLTVLDPSALPLLRPGDGSERVLKTWQGPHGIVAVVENKGNLRLKVNNYYRLGGSASAEQEQNQALIPLMSQPRIESLFFLGLGTGITAGAALRLPVERVTVCELVPQVIEAASEYFHPFANGLFQDPRVWVLAADGRHYLLAASEKYDAILADLFIPWKAGSGSLYTLEHFQAASRRLRPGGVFVQWLPLYQLSEVEFHIIARTMLAAFGQVVVWRGDFHAEKPILALAGSNEPRVLDPEVMVARGRQLSGGKLPAEAAQAVTLPFYMGNLSAAREIVPPGPLNTDDWPIIEYEAPITHRNARAGAESWFQGEVFARFCEQLARAAPPADDPYLARLDARQRGYVEAGLHYHLGAIAARAGDQQRAGAHLRAFERRIPLDFAPRTEEGEPSSAALE